MMQKIGNLFGDHYKQPPTKDRKTERGELIQYFHGGEVNLFYSS